MDSAIMAALESGDLTSRISTDNGTLPPMSWASFWLSSCTPVPPRPIIRPGRDDWMTTLIAAPLPRSIRTESTPMFFRRLERKSRIERSSLRYLGYLAPPNHRDDQSLLMPRRNDTGETFCPIVV